MRHIAWWLAPLLLLVPHLSAADTAATADATAQRVWADALATTRESDRWVAGNTLMTMEFLDRRGETDEVMKVQVTTRSTEDGLSVEITELERPGGLIGAMMSGDSMPPDGTSGASNSGESDGGSDGDGSLANPFLPEVQASLRIDSRAESDIINGQPCRAFTIGWEALDGTAYEGVIWLAESTAQPVLLDVTGRSASDAVQSLSAVVNYEPHGPTVVPVSTTSYVDIRFALVIRVRMRVTVEFSDYFERDETR
jgi:hypothetical protein